MKKCLYIDNKRFEVLDPDGVFPTDTTYSGTIEGSDFPVRRKTIYTCAEFSEDDLPGKIYASLPNGGEIELSKPLYLEALVEVARDRKITAIKTLRKICPLLGLKEAKEYIDKLVAEADCPF